MNLYAGSDAIELDNYYDDWEGQPTHILSYGYAEHKLGWYVGEEDLYLHIDMDTKGGQLFGNTPLTITTEDGQQVQFHIQVNRESGTVEVYNYSDWQGPLITTDGRIMTAEDEEGKPYERTEFRIPLGAISQEGEHRGMEAQIEIPTLGSQVVIIQGVSSGPLISVLLMGGIGVLGFLGYQKKRKEA